MNSQTTASVEIPDELSQELKQKIRDLVASHQGLVQIVASAPKSRKRVVISGKIPDNFSTNLASLLVGSGVSMEAGRA